MNFIEALKEMKKGNTVVFTNNSGFNFLYKIISDVVYLYSDKIGQWVVCQHPIDSLMKLNFLIYEEPKPEVKKGLWDQTRINDNLNNCYIDLKGIGHDFNKVSYLMQDSFMFALPSQQITWFKSLQTFMELKAHPLAEKSVYKSEQWYIKLGDEFNEFLDIDSTLLNHQKLSLLSPLFKTENDACEAIKDIGKERLIQMFKTFQGVYE